MRASKLSWVCGVVLVVLPSVRAGEREMALELVDKAIKAHGGADALNKAQTAIRSSTGTLTTFAGETAFTDEVTFGLPGRVRLIIKLDKGGQILGVLNADRGWRSVNGMAVELTKDSLEELQEEAYVDWLTTLVPLKKDGFDFALADGKMVNGKATDGIKVTRKGHRDARLYFEKDSGLLVKVERKTREAGTLLDKEYVFAGHKAFDGVLLPTKRTELVNSKKFVELTAASYRFPNRVDESAFAKP